MGFATQNRHRALRDAGRTFNEGDSTMRPATSRRVGNVEISGWPLRWYGAGQPFAELGDKLRHSGVASSLEELAKRPFATLLAHRLSADELVEIRRVLTFNEFAIAWSADHDAWLAERG